MEHSIVIERLRSAADRVPVDLDLDQILASGERRGDGRSRGWRRVAMVAACLLLVGAAVVGIATRADVGEDAAEPAARPEPPPPPVEPPEVPSSPEPPPSVDRFPVIPGGEPGAGQATAAWGGQIAWENPSRSHALVARVLDGVVTDGIALEVRSGWSGDEAPGAPQPTIVAGLEVEVYVEGGAPPLTTVVRTGEPVLTATGVDPVAFLEAAGGFPIVTADSSDFAIADLPAGYEVVVEPTPLPRGAISAFTQMPDGTTVVVDVVDPRLSLAQVGELRPVDVGGIGGWALDVGPGSTVVWPVSPTTWATVGGADDVASALAFARSIEFVDEVTWQERYQVPRADFPARGEAQDGQSSANDPVPTNPVSTDLVIDRREVPSEQAIDTPIACGDLPHLDDEITQPERADSPDAALSAFLATARAGGLFGAGYEQLVVDDGRSFRYERRNDVGDLVTVVVVEPFDGRWAVTRVLTSPC